MDSQPSIEFEKNHSNLFVKLTNVSGIGPVNRHNVWSISDFITCMIAHNITLPDWCTDDFLAELYEVNRFYWVVSFFFPQLDICDKVICLCIIEYTVIY